MCANTADHHRDQFGWSSSRMYGRTVSGASIWPMNTLAQTLVVSAPDTRITLVIAHAMMRTTAASPKVVLSTPISAAKMMVRQCPGRRR